jgi:ribose/xylose/arabinose/galactoside ABC-type transport system permease subunit
MKSSIPPAGQAHAGGARRWAKGRERGRGWGRRLLTSEYLVLYVSLVYFLALAPFAPGLATPGNLHNILSNMLPLLVVATGQTLVLISGGIDLSVTSIIALTSVLGALVMSGDNGLLMGHPLAAPAGIGVMLLGGALVGLFNGTAIAGLKMPPFIVTLTMMMFFSGFAIWLTQSERISNLPAGFTMWGREKWAALLVAGVVAVAAHLLLGRTLYGRWLYAAGHNARTARVSGVPVAWVIVFVYVLSGVCAAIASILYTGRLETGSPVMGQQILLDVIGATVIGGTSLYGGKGKVLWTVFGVLFLSLIDNSLNLLSLSHFTIMMVKGAVILVAAVLDSVRNRLLAA